MRVAQIFPRPLSAIDCPEAVDECRCRKPVGIPLKGLERQQDAELDDQLDPITYLDVVDLKRIVEHRDNWEHFESTMNIKLPTDRRGNAKNLSWFDTLNDIRKIMAHPANRSYKESHFEFLNFLEQELDKRLNSGE